MLLIQTNRESLLKPLQVVTGIVERRHTLPILSNVLIERSGDTISFMATDLEIQVATIAGSADHAAKNYSITVAAKKLQDILRSLSEDSKVSLEAQENRLQVKSGKSRFSLQTLPAEDFPKLAESDSVQVKIELPQRELKRLLLLVQYAMAQQDIRYYLNGLLFLVDEDKLKLVATDGHRLAYVSTSLGRNHEHQEVILPRKAVLELAKLLNDADELVVIEILRNQVRFSFSSILLMSKVVDGKFPDYTRVIPQGYDKRFEIGRISLLQALQRTAILSNEKFRGVRLVLTENTLRTLCSNNEQEEAQEELEVGYNGEALDIGFNVNYLQDVLNNVNTETIECAFGDANSSALITVPDNPEFKYVVMPMRI